MDSSSEAATFHKKVMQELLKNKKPLRGKKLNPSVLDATAEFYRLFIVQAIQRSVKTAKGDDETDVLPRHVQEILPQLLLDF